MQGQSRRGLSQIESSEVERRRTEGYFLQVLFDVFIVLVGKQLWCCAERVSEQAGGRERASERLSDREREAQLSILHIIGHR